MTRNSIAFIGSHNSGKTTLARSLAQVLTGVGYSVYLVPENIHRCPYRINEDTILEAQSWIFQNMKDCTEEALRSDADFIIFDRSVLDHVPYTLRAIEHSRISAQDGVKLVSATLEYWATLGESAPKLFYCLPLQEIRADGVRSTSKTFQTEIDCIYRQFLRSYQIPYFVVSREFSGSGLLRLSDLLVSPSIG